MDKKVRRKRPARSVIELEPRLNRPTPDIREDSTISQSRADYAIRLGLGDPDKIYFYRQALLDPDKAVQNPQLRHYVAEVAARALHLIFDDPQMWNRAQQLLRRKYPNQVASGMSEAAFGVLQRRAERRGCDFDAVMEAWSRGLSEGPEQAYARATSFIDGGSRDSDLRENFDLSAQHPSATGIRFKTHAVSHDDVSKKVDAMRKSHPKHYITVHNRKTGMVHTLRHGEKYDHRVLDEDARQKPRTDVLAKIRRAMEKK